MPVLVPVVVSCECTGASGCIPWLDWCMWLRMVNGLVFEHTSRERLDICDCVLRAYGLNPSEVEVFGFILVS